MRLILALGNPGTEYRDTRHNVGWWLADRLRAAWSFPSFRRDGSTLRSDGRRTDEEVRLAKPLTYVNRSGRAIREIREGKPLEVRRDLLVLVDDVSLPPGTIRVRARGSSGGHNGLASVEEACVTREYARLRIGVGRPDDDRIDLAEWVLSPPTGPEEEGIVGAFDRAAEAVDSWLAAGVEAAMNRYN